MLKGEKIALLAFVIYATNGYIYDLLEDVVIDTELSINNHIGRLVYWLQLKFSAMLAFVSAYYYTRDKYEIMSYAVLSYGVAQFFDEVITQLILKGASENDGFALAVMLLAVGYVAWKKRRKKS